MSRLNELSRQVQRLAVQAAPPAQPDYVLGAELLSEFWQEFANELVVQDDATLTDDARAALLLQYQRERAAEKTPDRIEQERRFSRKYDAAGAKASLLRELEQQIEREEREHEQLEPDAARG